MERLWQLSKCSLYGTTLSFGTRTANLNLPTLVLNFLKLYSTTTVKITQNSIVGDSLSANKPNVFYACCVEGKEWKDKMYATESTLPYQTGAVKKGRKNSGSPSFKVHWVRIFRSTGIRNRVISLARSFLYCPPDLHAK